MTTPAFLELQRLVRHMTDELASFRRRAFAAEARVRELEQELAGARARALEATPVRVVAAEPAPTTDLSEAGRSVVELQRENEDLRARLDQATQRTRSLLDRVRFLRQQEQEAAR